ncbi:hypothetical protein P618_200676 [Holospora obtusa F1]|uniref:Uncharacterized protein n=1 Tax=Holospora obtusa F1 TaxID=1399147 RepID=W6TDJ3_HOLOB|nr:hypothetical protein [Holospora obtusa]ETZ07133.1 hypothetical protein P618_200676 [Holospora obtusa F1]
MKDFYYVHSTEFENQDDPFLVLDSQEPESVRVTDLFPLRIELKAFLSFEPILARPVIQIQKSSYHPPLRGAVLYQSKNFFKSVSVMLCPIGWSEFEKNMELFEDSSNYRLDLSSPAFIQDFVFTQDSCVLNPRCSPLPCGVEKCTDPKDCMQWYCFPETSDEDTVLDWSPGQKIYGPNKILSLKQCIERGDVFCHLVYKNYRKSYRSQCYFFKNNELWISFSIIEISDA